MVESAGEPPVREGARTLALSRSGANAGSSGAGAPLTSQLLSTREVTVHFPMRRSVGRSVGVVRAVDGVSLSVLRGETVGLVGESGCGKSTFGRALIRLVGTTSGSIVFDGADVTALRGRALTAFRRRAQMVFQDPFGALNPRERVGALVRAGLEVHKIGTAAEREERVATMLARVGLAGMQRRFPHELSGGQRQRVVIARALVMSPEFVVADEPVSALDVSVQSQILNLLVEQRRELGLTLVFISHNLAAVEFVSDRVAVMYLGKVVEVGPADEVHRSPLHPYSAALVAAVPEIRAERRRERLILHGELPSASAPPSGCRFRTRCPIAQPICAEVEPPLEEKSRGRTVACHFAGKVS